MKNKIVREYDCVVDSKNRVTIRGNPKYKYYHVKVYKNGMIILEPRELVPPKESK